MITPHRCEHPYENKMETKDSPQIVLEVKNPLIMGNVQYISVNDFQLSTYEKEKAYRELNETEDQKIHYLKELKKKLEENGSKLYRTDDEYLLRYLRYGKYNLDKAYKVISNFYSVRTKNRDIFTIPPDFETLLKKDFMTYLPYMTEERNIIFRVNFRNWKLEEMSLVQVLQASHLVLDIMTMNPRMQINGLIGIWDFRGVTLKHAVHSLKPRMIWILLNFMQEVYPHRVKLTLGIYTNSVIRTAFNTCRHLLKKKIADRIVFLGSDMTEVHNYINPVLLPREYGGTLEDTECVSTQDVLKNMPYLRYEHSFV